MDEVTKIKNIIYRFVDIVGEGKISIKEISLEPKFTIDSLQTEWMVETYVVFLSVHRINGTPKIKLTHLIENYLGWEVVIDEI